MRLLEPMLVCTQPLNIPGWKGAGKIQLFVGGSLGEVSIPPGGLCHVPGFQGLVIPIMKNNAFCPLFSPLDSVKRDPPFSL